MLTEDRMSIILSTVQKKGSAELTDLCEILGASISTVRRDVNQLAEMGKLTKVHGGVIAIDDSFSYTEKNVEEKSGLFTEEKTAIAEYAASLIDSGDFIFIDAGTTTEKLIDLLPAKNAVFVTNGFLHAKKLASRGFKVYIPGGEIKVATEAIVGEECVKTLKDYHFTKAFLGANGISISAGCTTPDVREARIKSIVAEVSRKVYILADHSKFDQVSSATFAHLNTVEIITDKLTINKYKDYTIIKEAN